MNLVSCYHYIIFLIFVSYSLKFVLQTYLVSLSVPKQSSSKPNQQPNCLHWASNLQFFRYPDTHIFAYVINKRLSMSSIILSVKVGVCALLLLCFIGPLNGWAQGGRGDGSLIVGGTRLPFTPGSNALSDTGIPLPNPVGPGGSAVANDPVTGELLFYAGGGGIYDAQGNLLQALGGDADANQPVTVVPVPGDDLTDGIRQYYVFANEGGVIRRYTVSVNVQNAPVATVNPVVVDTGIAGAADALVVVPNADNSNYWVVTQIDGTGDFSVYDVAGQTATPYPGVSPQALSATNISFSATSGQLAVATTQGVRLLTINRSTGALTETSDFAVPSNEAVYDTEWSPDGTKLFVSTGATGNVYQHDVATGVNIPINNLVPGVGNYGLQIGPDGNIYHLYEAAPGEFRLARINSPNQTGATGLTVESNLLGGVNLGGRQFSSTASADIDFSGVSIQIKDAGQCTNNPVHLTPNFVADGVAQPANGIPDPDSVVWLINGQRFVGLSPTFVPEEASLGVQVTAYWGDDSVSVGPLNVDLQEFDLQVPLVQDTTICPGDEAILKAEPESGGGQGGQTGGQTGGGNYTYQWSTGETTPEITVDEAAVYWVLVTDPSTGCAAYAESNVKEYRVENQTYNEWYFGTGGGINFNTLYDDPDDPDDGQITPVGDGSQSAPEGVEAVSDPNGDILFYTDGQTVWFVGRDPATGEKVHTPMPIAGNPPPAGIGGDPQATQVVSIPVPGTEAMYYIFTTTAVEEGGYALRYSIVDLRGSQASSGPSVVSSNNLLFVKSTERIAIQGGNGGNATLVAHEYGTNNFRAYPITQQGIGNPVISSAGAVHTIDQSNTLQGQMTFGGDSSGAVVATVVDNRVELFNFDTETLEISEPVTIDFTGLGNPYGIEMVTDSTGNTVLYVSTDNGIYGATVQRPLNEGQTIPVVLVDGTAGNTYGAIQRGPDGQIYVAQPGETNIGTLAPNPNDPANSGFNAAALPDGLPNGAVSGFGLPTYVSFGGNSFPDPSISVDEACVGNEINFSAQGRDDVIETYSWTIERVDASGNFLYNVGIDSADAQNFTMMIDSAGSYVAKVLLSNDCEPDTTLTQTFEVTDGVETTLPESAQLCQGGIDITAVEGIDVSGLSFAWVRRGAAGGGNLPAENTISVDEEGYYFVTVTNAEGCTSEDSIFIVDERPRIELPGDTTLCVGDELRLDVRAPSIRETPPGYEWVILDENGATLQTSNEPVLEVDETTPDPGTYQYTVTVTDEFGCFVRDTVAITISPSVEIALAKVDPSACATDNGSITLTFPNGEDPTQYSYRWSGPNGFTSTQQNLTDIGSGVYSVTVTGLSNCPVTESIGLDDPATFNVTSATPEPGCDDSGTITVALSGLTPTSPLLPIDVRVVGNEGYEATLQVFADQFIITNLAPDTYTFSMTSADGCAVTASAVIDEPEEVDFDFAQDVVTDCGEATLSVNYSPTSGDQWFFEWIDPSGNVVLQGNDQSSFSTSVSGTYEVRVTNVDGVDPAGNAVCPATKDIPVFVDESFLISLEEVEPDNSCETGEKQLTVNFNPEETIDRDLSYRWELNGTQLPLVTRTITVTETGNYRVTVRDRNSACEAPNEPIPVLVNQPISVALFYGSACADGSSVPLYAGVQATGTDSLVFRWFGPNGQALPQGTGRGDTLLIRPDYPEGQYQVEVTSFIQEIESCQATATVDFSRDPVPTSNLGLGPFVICSKDSEDSIRTVTLRVDNDPLSTIRWIFFGEETTDNGEFAGNNADLVVNTAGTYIVEVTNEFGCTTVDSVEVIEDCAPRITAPNAFRPGGVNAEFFVYHKYVSTNDFDVKIYNRWGELVYQSNDRDFRWDGTYNGRQAPLGTYPYVVRFKADTEETSSNIRESRGGVTIIR